MRKYVQCSITKRHISTLYNELKQYTQDSTSRAICYFELKGFLDGLYLSEKISANAYNLYNALARKVYYKAFKAF